MTKRTQLTRNELIEVMRLMADVAAHHDDVAVQRQMLADGLCKLIGAAMGFGFLCRGWKEGMAQAFLDSRMTQDSGEFFSTYMRDVLVPHNVQADPYCDVSIRSTAPMDRLVQRDVLPSFDAWDKYDPYSDWGRRLRLCDGMVSWARLDSIEDGAIVGLSFHRIDRDRMFTPCHHAMIDLAMRELYQLSMKGYYKLPEFNVELAELANRLSPRLREVLSLILAGRHAKGIALDLNLSIHTMREHMQRLYRHFDVDGRDALMALFFGKSELK